MKARTTHRVTYLLAGIGLALLVLALAQQYGGVGQGYSWLEEGITEPAKLNANMIDQRPFNLPPQAKFAETEQRPLFNNDRKPTPADAAPATAEAPPPAPLNVELTGIIVTPKLSMALVHDNVKNQALSLKVGMPLEGTQGNWTLAEIRPRSVIFKNAADEQNEVELKTAASSPKPVPSPAVKPPSAKTAAAAINPRAAPPPPEDLAHRIEERRRQMREGAAREQDPRNIDPAAPQPNDAEPSPNDPELPPN